jgi:ferredoxin
MSDAIEIRQWAGGERAAAPPLVPDRMTLVRCIGCGAIDPSRDCLAICDDHALELVEADRHDRAEQRARAAATAAEALGAVVRAIANAAPDGDGRVAYAALRDDARYALRIAAAATEPSEEAAEDDGVVRAWGCAACGRVEAPQPCLGICVRHPVDFVRADLHRHALAREATATGALTALAVRAGAALAA